MKRTFGILAGLAALGGVAYLGSQLLAQNYSAPPAVPGGQPVQPAAAAPVQTRIALVNLSLVMKKYKKFESVQQELVSKQGAYKTQYETYNKDMTAKQAEMAKPETSQLRRDQLAKDIKDIQRKVQDLEEDMKKVLGQLQADRMTQLYRDIEDAVGAYAKARNIELVLHYNDGIGQDKYLPAFLSRRVANGACMPIYNVPGMDISDAVANMLNARPQTSVQPGSSIPPVPGTR